MAFLGESGLSDALIDEGIDPLTMAHLGTGTRGAVFDIGAERVAKFTTDQDEAEVSRYLAGREMRYIWPIRSVLAMSQPQASELISMRPELKKFVGKPMWLVVGRRLDAVPDQDQMLAAIRWLKARGVRGSLGLAPLRAAALRTELDRIEKTGETGDPALLAGAWVGYARFVLDAYYELRRAGIGFHDLHAGNVRQGPRGPLLIDLGYSSPPVEDPIPPLEAA
jgi:hypothetical protein